tara:strand:+ start:10109 stop:10450 length:342 start_codon:yes stop_codon:yes gene_type:complete
MDSDLFLKFIFGCILVRILFVVMAYKIDRIYLPYLGILAIIPTIGFLAIYFGLIKRKSGAFGQKIWWNDLRPVHAFLYLCFTILAINKKKYSYIPLLIDVLIGIIFFINNHYY